MTIEELKNDYIFLNTDPHFSIGPRENLRYITKDIMWASLIEINPNGIDAIDYLNFAKADIFNQDLRGALNAIGNAKRAIHLIIDCFLEILGLLKIYNRKKFPEKLQIIDELDAFPTRLIQYLNRTRNIIEHEFDTVDIDDADEFIEIAELFIRLSYPYLKHMVIGAHVGLKKDDRDIEWVLNPKKSEIQIYEHKNSEFIDTDIGKIYYNYSKDEADKILLKQIVINKNNISEWSPFLNSFIYCTQKTLIPENPPYDQENYERLKIFTSTSLF